MGAELGNDGDIPCQMNGFTSSKRDEKMNKVVMLEGTVFVSIMTGLLYLMAFL